MATIIYLDETAILDNESVLTHLHRDFRVYIPPTIIRAVKDPSSSDPRSKSRSQVLESALNNAKVFNAGVDFSSTANIAGASGTYADILGHALYTQSHDRDSSVIVVSADLSLNKLAIANHVNIVTPTAYIAMVDAATKADVDRTEYESATAAAKQRSQKYQIIIGIVTGLLLIVLAWLSWRYREVLLSTVNTWGALISAALVGGLLYALRGRLRIGYGILEVGVGMMSAMSSFATSTGSAPTTAPTFTTAMGIAVLGGIYIIVRGLDNIGKALEKTPYENTWRKFSGEKKSE